MADLAALSELPAPPPPVLLPTPGALAPPVMVPEAAPELDPMLLMDQPALDAQLQPPVLLPSPPMSDIQAAEAEVVGGARDIERATGQIDRLQTRGAELAGTALASTDPEERAALGDRIGAIGEAGKRIDQERAATRAAVEQSALELQGQSEVAAAEATAAAARERAQQSAELREQFAGREAERAERQVVAREQFAKDREEASRAMRAEPSGASWQSVIEVVGETMRAERAGEVPRYGEIVARAMNAGRQRHQDKVAASVDQMNLSLDSVQRISLEQSELRAVESAERAAIFDAVEERLTAEMATIQEPLARAQAAQRIDQVRQQRAQAEAAAVQARDESELKRRKARADAGLVEAKTATELAKAAKLGRRGGGGGGKAAPGLVAANVVPIPGTDTPLVTFSDDAKGRAEAKATRDIVGEQQSFLETMNGVEAFYEDAEKQGLLSSIGVRGSDANERLSAMLGVAAGKLAQIKAGPGKATTASDEEWAEQFLPENPKSWTNKARGMRRITQATSVFEDESRSLLGRSTRLDTATRERVVKEARKRSVSQTQRARTLASRAAQTVGDRSKDSATRAKAVELIEENARAQAQQGGDWLELATAQTATALEGVEDTDVLAAGSKQLAKYRRLVEDREKGFVSAYPGMVTESRGPSHIGPLVRTEDPQFGQLPDVKANRAVKAKIEKAGRAMAKRQLGAAGASLATMLGLDDE